MDDEQVVQNGLAVSPGNMLELTKQGLSISSQNQSQLYVDEGDFGIDVPLEFQRGMDMADLWNARADVREKVREAMSNPDNIILEGGE